MPSGVYEREPIVSRELLAHATHYLVIQCTQTREQKPMPLTAPPGDDIDVGVVTVMPCEMFDHKMPHKGKRNITPPLHEAQSVIVKIPRSVDADAQQRLAYVKNKATTLFKKHHFVARTKSVSARDGNVSMSR